MQVKTMKHSFLYYFYDARRKIFLSKWCSFPIHNCDMKARARERTAMKKTTFNSTLLLLYSLTLCGDKLFPWLHILSMDSLSLFCTFWCRFIVSTAKGKKNTKGRKEIFSTSFPQTPQITQSPRQQKKHKAKNML